MESKVEKSGDVVTDDSIRRGSVTSGDVLGKPEVSENDFEVFARAEGAVDFRTVSWVHAAMIFLKVIFATGVLSIPSQIYVLGSLPGSINVICWTLLNMYLAIVQGNFRNRHPKCHSQVDMAFAAGGFWLSETVGILFIVGYVISAASGIVGVATALNALSNHGTCTVVFNVVATILAAGMASIRKFEKIAWMTWLGFFSVFVAVLVVVVGVTTLDRPAAAPQTGTFDLGYRLIGHPDFAMGVTAASTIFVSSAGTGAFLPVISEMRHPRDYNKAVYACMSFVTAAYFVFSLVVYRYCGKWVASPSLGSAGPLLKKVAYGVGIVGLAISACLYVHVAAKYVFVRVLRRSRHLQHDGVVHWATWLSCTVGIAAAAFLIASGVPIFSYIIALAGGVCFAPTALMLPGYLWVHDHKGHRVGTPWQRALFWAHVGIIVVGAFMSVGGTYGVVVQIIDAYKTGSIDRAFSCADNSNSS